MWKVKMAQRNVRRETRPFSSGDSTVSVIEVLIHENFDKMAASRQTQLPVECSVQNGYDRSACLEMELIAGRVESDDVDKAQLVPLDIVFNQRRREN